MVDPGAVELIGITKRHGAAAAVDGVSLRVPAGACCCLLGLSGCGKATTLRIIAGHETATAGMVRVGAKCVTRTPPSSRASSAGTTSCRDRTVPWRSAPTSAASPGSRTAPASSPTMSPAPSWPSSAKAPPCVVVRQGEADEAVALVPDSEFHAAPIAVGDPATLCWSAEHAHPLA